MEWFKFYHNKWLSDLAIGKLKPEDRLCFITLLCVASQSDERDGFVARVNEEQLIILTRLPVNIYDEKCSPYHQAVGCLERLEMEGLIEVQDNDSVLIKNFEKRQNSNFTDAERARRYRENQKNVTNVTRKSDGHHHREEESREDKKRVDKIREEPGATKSREFSTQSAEIIKEFEAINPACKKFYNNKTQRQAAEDLIETYSYDSVIKVIREILPQSNKTEFVASITTPYELWQKWTKLAASMQKIKNNKEIIL